MPRRAPLRAPPPPPRSARTSPLRVRVRLRCARLAALLLSDKSCACVIFRIHPSLAPAGATNGTAARDGGSVSFWDSASGAGHGDSGGSAPLTSTCLKRQADSFCVFKPDKPEPMELVDPIADDKPKYLFTQTFADEALHPGVQVSDGLAYGHKHYTVTIEAADHIFHEKLSPQTVYGYNGKYPADSFEARQFEPLVVEVR
jgi:hypothetical protein